MSRWPNISIKDRFEKYVMPVPECGCHIWIGACDTTGYGRFRDHNGLLVAANRMAWEIYKGPIPDNLLVLHTCDTPSCVNPRHLFLGNYRDNIKDAYKKEKKIKP